MSSSRISAGARPAPAWRDAVWPCVVVIAGVMLGFAFYTGQVWEDFLITFRFSRNLAEGHGLVYQIGERVQGFTSPLNTLVPAIACKLWPKLDYVAPLWAFRIFGLVVFSAGLALFLRSSGTGGWRWICVALLAVQVKTVAFAMNGQEAALLVGFLALSVIAAVRGQGAAWRLAGLGWAGLMWTRPDCPVYIAAIAAGGLAVGGEPWRRQLAGVAKAAALTALLYGPWLVWTWVYYGSPVPHTITAKFGTGVHSGGVGGWIIQYCGTWIEAVGRPFEPIYSSAGGWPGWLFVVTRSLGLVCALRWSLPGDRLSRLCSWVLFCGAGYLAFVGTVGYLYPWYLPPLGFCGAVVLARGFAAAWSGAASQRARGGLLLVAGGVAAVLAWMAVFGFEQQRLRQRFVEEGVREPLGRWLKTQVGADERVFLEPIGYIGYFSNARVLDYPGLVSPAVVRLRRAGVGSRLGLIAALRPEWVVFRGAEARLVSGIREFATAYAPVAQFKAPRELLAYRSLPGRGYLFADSFFVVFRRRDAGEVRTLASESTASSAPRRTKSESGPGEAALRSE